jgi:uncharacterized HhH-GPD family protein
MILNEKLMIVNKLKEFGKILESKSSEWIVKYQDPIEFLFGVIFDQGIRAERAWSAPAELKKRLGHLDPFRIANMSEEDLEKILFQKPALHRYRKIAGWLIEACQLLVTRYNGKAENIWNDNPTAKDLENRFREFKGIKQKKASMAVNILVRDFKVPIRDVNKKGIDVSYDVHVRRVFLRTGLVDKDKESVLIKVARELNPEYPGELDLPAWEIGRTWCHPIKPECDNCVLKDVCPKLLHIKIPSA